MLPIVDRWNIKFTWVTYFVSFSPENAKIENDLNELEQLLKEREQVSTICLKYYTMQKDSTSD